jgi:hypothetical protein
LRDLNEMTIGQRIALTFVIVLIILFALTFIGWISGGWDEAPAAPLLVASPFDQRLAELEHEALDESYRQRVHLLFTNWLNDTRDQPKRMLVGISNARAAYTEAMTEIQKRERR